MGEKVYNVGLDIGIASVGWAVTDGNAHLLKFKGQNMWGVRLFDEADTAATRRGYRSTRRRLNRRKQRLNQLKEIFEPEIVKVDPNFFIRQKESFLYTEDTSTLSVSILFDDSGFSDKEYYESYPTIYHLRKDLLDSRNKKDIRLIYLALHHILKYRGHFLYGKGELRDNVEDINLSLGQVFSYLMDDEFDSLDIDFSKVKSILTSVDSKKAKEEQLKKIVKHSDKEINEKMKEIIKAILGYKFNLNKLFGLEDLEEKLSVSFKDDLNEVKIEGILQEGMNIYNSIKSVYNWATLEELLGDIESQNPSDKTISNAMVSKYNTHGKQLKMLKTLIRDTCSREDYYNLFRDENKNNNYPSYIKKPSKNSLEDFNRNIKDILKEYPLAKNHKYYAELSKYLDENNLLSKLNTTDNAVIPNQLHKVEMERIIENQSEYYPFLAVNKGLLVKVLESRLSYYVGPLNRSSKFAWNIPLKDKAKSGPVYPWNFEDFIDIDATAEEFIKRMTNKCTYLKKEDVIPRQSLLYSEFVLLNELNKVRINKKLICKDTKREIINNLFKKKKTVRVKDLEDWVRKNPSGFIINKSDDVLIEGTQEEVQFAASLGSYIDFQNIFGEIDDSNVPMIEEIINWITIFQDKEILKRKVKEKYGLNNKTISRIMALKYSGWSRLSKKLIDGIRTQKTEWTGYTIIEIMRSTNMNFMQIINDKELDFEEAINLLNSNEDRTKISYEDIKELQGSPALKRGIWETIKITDEIVKIMNCEPKNIFIEFARSDEEKKRTTSRINRIRNLYDEIRKDADVYNKEVYDELQKRAVEKDRLDNRALYLYFTQNGKCMYTGTPLEVDNLDKYEIDHIIPRSYIKNDSLDNIVLVTKGANQNKSDDLLLNYETRKHQKEYWDNLYKYGLISKRKLKNLNRDKIPDKDLIGFINRQLVETRQISKHVSELLSEVYEDTRIVAIKAKLTSDFREQYKLYKNREVNDYHHAHDALIASVLGNYILNRYPFMENEVDIKKYISWFKKEKMHSDNKNKYGFILASMNKDYLSYKFKWEKNQEIGRVKNALSYKDCFITKKVEEQTGEFFKATIYGKESADAKIPLKKGLDTKKYGGRTGMKDAYFMVIEYVRKEKLIRKIVGIPIFMAKRDMDSIKEYLVSVEEIQDRDSLKIIKDKIKKYQLLEYDGHQMYLISTTELQNGVQLIIDDKYKGLLHIIYNEKSLTKFESDKIHELMSQFVDYYIEKLSRHYPFYSPIVKKLKNNKDRFKNLEFVQKTEFIKQLLNLSAVDSKTGNFKDFDFGTLKSTREGRILKRSKDSWELEKIVFIDKSITGLYERRYRL